MTSCVLVHPTQRVYQEARALEREAELRGVEYLEDDHVLPAVLEVAELLHDGPRLVEHVAEQDDEPALSYQGRRALDRAREVGALRGLRAE